MKITMVTTVVAFAVLMGIVSGRGDAAPSFAQAPRVEKEGDGYVITFAVRSECDVTVWVAAAKTEQIVRHLAVGRLGPNAPEPFQKGTLKQRLVWDGRDDRGRPVPAGCTVGVGLGLTAGFGRMLYQTEPGVGPHAIGHPGGHHD